MCWQCWKIITHIYIVSDPVKFRTIPEKTFQFAFKHFPRYEEKQSERKSLNKETLCREIYLKQLMGFNST